MGWLLGWPLRTLFYLSDVRDKAFSGFNYIGADGYALLIFGGCSTYIEINVWPRWLFTMVEEMHFSIKFNLIMFLETRWCQKSFIVNIVLAIYCVNFI